MLVKGATSQRAVLVKEHVSHGRGLIITGKHRNGERRLRLQVQRLWISNTLHPPLEAQWSPQCRPHSAANGPSFRRSTLLSSSNSLQEPLTHSSLTESKSLLEYIGLGLRSNSPLLASDLSDVVDAERVNEGVDAGAQLESEQYSVGSDKAR
jgi:hypothetical protein